MCDHGVGKRRENCAQAISQNIKNGLNQYVAIYFCFNFLRLVGHFLPPPPLGPERVNQKTSPQELSNALTSMQLWKDSNTIPVGGIGGPPLADSV